MKKTIKINRLVLPLLISLPVLLLGCEGASGLFSSSHDRTSRSDHRPQTIYESGQPTSHSARQSQTRSRSSASYSITNQQGRTHRQTVQDEHNDRANSDNGALAPPSVPSTAPQLMD